MSEWLPVTAQVIVLAGVLTALGIFGGVCIWAWREERRRAWNDWYDDEEER